MNFLQKYNRKSIFNCFRIKGNCGRDFAYTELFYCRKFIGPAYLLRLFSYPSAQTCVWVLNSFENPQHMFWLRNKKNNFRLRTHIWGPGDWPHFNSLPIVTSADNLCKQFWTQAKTDKMPGPILIQTVWHFKVIPDFFFWKSWFWTKSAVEK